MTAHAHQPAARVAAPRPAAHEPVRIRQATLEDLEAIVAMRLALLREEARSPLFADPHPDAPARAARLTAAQLRDDDQVFLLAEVDSRPIGLLRCTIGTGSPVLRESTRGFLSTAYVKPRYRKRGVLRRLVGAAVTWCAAHDVHDLRLHVTRENAEGNAAWEALGFEVVEVVRRRRPG
jgi:ribosomal protein S18 acetylase RimI-like enzyme